MVISVEFNSDILYVSGTVNGLSYIFDSVDKRTWTADVEKSEDDYYSLALQLLDEAGNTSTYSGTFYYPLPEFVYDRTQADIDSRTWKGFLNASDLNRIDRATELIGGYISVPVSVKYDWDIGGLPRVADFDRIQANITNIRAGYGVYSNTPKVPDRPYNHYQKWNDIEKILHDVFYIYIGNYNNKIYCGDEAYSGEEIGVL